MGDLAPHVGGSGSVEPNCEFAFLGKTGSRMDSSLERHAIGAHRDHSYEIDSDVSQRSWMGSRVAIPLLKSGSDIICYSR